MATAIGALKSRIILQQQVRASDSAGGFTSHWTTAATPWARVVQSSGGEQPEGGQDPSRREFTVTLRRRAVLSTAMRVCWGAVVMNIVSIKDDDDDPEFATLACIEEPGAKR